LKKGCRAGRKRVVKKGYVYGYAKLKKDKKRETIHQGDGRRNGTTETNQKEGGPRS